MIQENGSVLVVTPDESQRRVCSTWLREEGLDVIEARNGSEALSHHRQRVIPFTVSDVTLDEFDGVELLYRIRTLNADAEVALFTNTNPTEMAVTAIKAGASDFLLKPVDRDRLIEAARAATEHYLETKDLEDLRRGLYKKYDFSDIVARSPSMLKVLELAGRIAPLDCTVLVTGQSGTGKEMIARAIHANNPCRDHRFVSINCAAIPEALLESELFGYRRGAFTGATADKAGLLEIANGGTILLDEIGEISLGMQAKLLQFLQHQVYFPVGATQPVQTDVRIIAATNADLRRLVEAGKFREDLFYRLHVFPLRIPPLSERSEDIVPLARHFLAKLEGQVGKPVPGLSREAARYLRGLPWPGNVRQLENAIEYAVIISDGNLLTSKDFRTASDAPGSPIQRNGEPQSWHLPEEGIDLDSLVKSLTVQALDRTGYRIGPAAKLLGLTRATMRYRMKKYCLSE